MNIPLSIALTLLLLPILSGCNSGGLEKKIADTIKERCQHAGNCTIRITELTDFAWDRMHVFSYGATYDDVRNGLGVDFPQYTEFARKIVFIKEGRIIHSEEHASNVERRMNGEVVFDIPDRSVHKVYTPDNAIFNVTRWKFEGGVWFEMKQKNDVPNN
jgi:hypothetical protein